MSSWYKKRSLVIVQNDNELFASNGSKKHSRKYGNLHHSPYLGLNKMLWEHRELAEEFVLQILGMPPTVKKEVPEAMVLSSLPIAMDPETMTISTTAATAVLAP